MQIFMKHANQDKVIALIIDVIPIIEVGNVACVSLEPSVTAINRATVTRAVLTLY